MLLRDKWKFKRLNLSCKLSEKYKTTKFRPLISLLKMSLSKVFFALFKTKDLQMVLIATNTRSPLRRGEETRLPSYFLYCLTFWNLCSCLFISRSCCCSQDLNKRQGLALLSKVGESVKNVAGGYKLRVRPPEFCAMGEYLDTFNQKLGTIDRIAQRILKEQSGKGLRKYYLSMIILPSSSIFQRSLSTDALTCLSSVTCPAFLERIWGVCRLARET